MEVGSRWRHYKGGEYVLVCCARIEATLEPVVVYQKAPGPYGECWVRPLSEWSQEVGPGVKRYTPIRPGTTSVPPDAAKKGE